MKTSQNTYNANLLTGFHMSEKLVKHVYCETEYTDATLFSIVKKITQVKAYATLINLFSVLIQCKEIQVQVLSPCKALAFFMFLMFPLFFCCMVFNVTLFVNMQFYVSCKEHLTNAFTKASKNVGLLGKFQKILPRISLVAIY